MFSGFGPEALSQGLLVELVVLDETQPEPVGSEPESGRDRALADAGVAVVGPEKAKIGFVAARLVRSNAPPCESGARRLQHAASNCEHGTSYSRYGRRFRGWNA